MKIMKTKRLCVVILLIAIVLPACTKSSEPPTENDWREQYGVTQNGTVTPEPEKPAITEKPTDFDISSIELPFPTPLPIREFVPQEGQVELRLWMFGSHEEYLDDHIVAELNYILQERGYAFYLTKRVEPKENKVGQISRWQETLDSGETIDLIYLGDEDNGLAYKEYGNTAILRAITGGYLLPFFEYPETEAKERLLSAYPEAYWKLCSFEGENYGVSHSVADAVKGNNYLMLNLDAAESLGIEIPETLDVLQLDEMLRMAEEAGIPGMESMSALTYNGIMCLDSGLYVKYSEEGKYRIVNPLEDEGLLSVWDALYRYKKNGWGEVNTYATGEFPLIMYKNVADENWDGERLCMRSEKGEISTRVKIYEKSEHVCNEGAYGYLLGIYSGSKHKEEALELLSLMNADEEIVQLLRYGIEGVHYRIGEGGMETIETSEINMYGTALAISNKTWSFPGKKSFGNRLLYVELENNLGLENKEEEWYAGYSEIKLIPYLETFTEEQKKIQEKVREITFITGKGGYGMSLTDISSYLILLNDDYREQIEALRLAFEEAGYNELAKEVNEAYGLE